LSQRRDPDPKVCKVGGPCKGNRACNYQEEGKGGGGGGGNAPEQSPGRVYVADCKDGREGQRGQIKKKKKRG